MKRLDQEHQDQPSLFDMAVSDASAPVGSESKPKESFWDQHVQPAIDQVEENADEDWKQAARDCLHTLAETHDELTADDLIELLETKEVQTHNLAALGPIFQKASGLGWIENTERVVRTRIPRRHRKITIWKSLLR